MHQAHNDGICYNPPFRQFAEGTKNSKGMALGWCHPHSSWLRLLSQSAFQNRERLRIVERLKGLGG